MAKRRSFHQALLGNNSGVKAPEVIATHANTDFDAFASLLAARRLYPDAVVAIQGTLNRNVREFYRLHADELDAIESSRLEPEAIRRLIVVETSSRDDYDKTRRFYENTMGYETAAHMRDFYKPGDDKVVYLCYVPRGDSEVTSGKG